MGNEKVAIQQQAAPNIVLPESNAIGDIVIELGSPNRLALLEKLEILDAPAERTFQVLTEMSNRMLGTPVSLISLVTPDRQFFVSSCGLSEPYCSQRETAISHSFCQHVVKRNEPLVISDARNHPLVMKNLAVPDLNVVAYLGVPLVFHDGTVLGSFCSIDGSPREWTQTDLNTLTEFASIVVGELEVRRKALRETRELEQRLRQAQKMEAIGNFTSGIAHDFNHALGVIQINADLLNQKHKLEPNLQVHVERIQEAIGYATEITSQLLNWSRPDTSDFELVSLSTIVDEAMPLFKALVSKNINIEFQNQAGLGHIFANRGQIKQALLNLIGNANDAMENTTGKISLALASTRPVPDGVADSSESVTLTIADQGCGMPNDILHRIHDPYFTTKPPGKGTGLGLWNVQGIVKAHKAIMTVSSQLDRGTEFKVVFPCPKSSLKSMVSCTKEQNAISPNTSENRRTEVIHQRQRQSTIHVLVVDDEPLLADGITENLELAGFKVAQFLDGKKALQYFKENRNDVDLVITDQVMPHIAGDKLVQEILSINSEVKTIICSGVIETVSTSGTNKPRANMYLKKPFRLRELMDAVERVIGPIENGKSA